MKLKIQNERFAYEIFSVIIELNTSNPLSSTPKKKKKNQCIKIQDLLKKLIIFL